MSCGVSLIGRQNIVVKRFKSPFNYGLTGAAHEAEIVGQIVDCIQTRTKYLVCTLQMMQISSRKMAAGIAIALRVEPLRVAAMDRVANSDDPLRGKKMAVAGVSRR